MVLHKRLDYGSSGYQVPPMPRVPRSARGKRSVRKKVDDKQISAFDLLATVAGELLSERENSPPPSKISGMLNPTTVNSTIKQERNENEIKTEVFDQSSCNESTLGSESAFKRQVNYKLKEPSQTPKSLEKDAREVTVNNGKRDEVGYALPTIYKKCRAEGSSSGLKADVGIKTLLQAKQRMNGNVVDESVPEILEDPMDLDAKPPALVSSDSSVEVPIARNGSFPMCRNGMELVDRDDDENSSWCTHPSTNIAKAFRPQHIGDRRVRKLLGSKFWKVPPMALKDGEFLNTDVEMKPVRSRKVLYTRQRSQRSSFKRRKLFERHSVSASTGGIYGENIPNSPKSRGIKIDAADAHASLNGANGASSSSSGQKSSSYESGDYHVKFSIKSFKVPELFIEIPETATVGSLKRTVMEAVTTLSLFCSLQRTVMEAVTAILSGGLRVSVVLQGKKVRDDKQTLLQAGISHNDKMENLGFTLEPNSTQAPPPLTCPEDPNSLVPSNPVLPCASTELIQRIPSPVPVSVPAPTPAPAPVLVSVIDQLPLEVAPELPQTSTFNCAESDHDSVHSHTDVSSVDKTTSSKALIPVPDMNADPLNVTPLRKSRQSELVQRRIRRPFSVGEVEALVQAVEKLGTGRWRDVKIRAFDNAKHRTYVDLKDKWKTLVHTARISPQQRRGEPVPLELLDRVLSAHAYWTQQQAKLQVKPSGAEPCLLI